LSLSKLITIQFLLEKCIKMWFKKQKIQKDQTWFHNTGSQYLCTAEILEVTKTSVKFKQYLYEYGKLVSVRATNILTKRQFRKDFYFYK
jgi:hypothetical protein